VPGDVGIVVEAPAKVNLHLSVGDVRPDGFHDVETVLHALDLCDTVTLERSRGLSLVCDVDLGIPAEANLAMRAAVALATVLNRVPDVRITLEKRIPAGAGLGGASTDAAAVLAGLPSLWEVEVSGDTLRQIAVGLGADVPFFLRGGSGLYSGRGDVFVEEIDVPVLDVALVKPRSHVSTARAYAMFDRIGVSSRTGAATIIAACRSGDPRAVAGALHNNLTEAAVALVPEIADVMAVCDAHPGVLGCLLSGSGSAVFAVCDSSESASGLAERGQAQGLWARATRSRADVVRRIAEGRA